MRTFGSIFAMALLVGAAPSATPPAGFVHPFNSLRLSAELARRGTEVRDPLLLLAAARLRRAAGVTLDPGTPDRADDWIAKAEEIGASDPRIASLAADLRAETTKGRLSGPRVGQAVLRAGERRSFAESFRIGRPAVVYIEGDGDTALSLKVSSACSDAGPGDVKICAWTPDKTTQVTVEIGNLGRVENRVIIGIN